MQGEVDVRTGGAMRATLLRAAGWLPFALVVAAVHAPALRAQTSGLAAPLTGDCTSNAAGAVTCTRTGGTAFAPSATVDTTNAANLSSGTVPAARTAALTGDVTKAAGAAATTVTSYNGGTAFGNAAAATTGTAAGNVVVNSAANTIAQSTTGNAATAGASQGNFPVNGLLQMMQTANMPAAAASTAFCYQAANGTACYTYGPNAATPGFWTTRLYSSDASVNGGTLVFNTSGLLSTLPINTSVGFRVNNAAAAGQFLVGDGTNFAPRVLLPGDVPNLDAGKIVSGTLAVAQTAALTGDVAKAAGSAATTVGSFNGGTAFGNAAAATVGSAGGNLLARDGNGMVPLAASQGLALDTAGLLGLYLNTDTSGVAVDASGNGNHGTITTGPARNGTNYTFTANTQNVDFPAAVNAVNSYYFAVTVPATPGGQNMYANGASSNALVTNSAANGIRISLAGGYNGIFGNQAGGLVGYAQLSQATSNGGSNNWTGDVWTGFHVVTLTCPSGAAGLFYLDGVPLPNVNGGTAACNNINASGNVRLGSAPVGTWPQGVVYWAEAFYSTVDSAATVARRAMALRQYGIGKGALSGLAPAVPAMTARIVGQGDSILCGYTLDAVCNTQGAGTSANAYLKLAAAQFNNSYAVVNYGVPSAMLGENLAAAPTLVDPQGLGNYGQNLYVVEGGTNDYNQAYVSVAAVWGKRQALAAGRAAAGFRPILIGLLSRGGNCGTGGNCDAQMQAQNANDRAQWKNSKYAAYLDVGSDPLLGATGASANPADTSCNTTAKSSCTFYTDALHLYTAGHTRMATALACLVNGLDGSSASNMNPAAITAASTTLTCADGGRLLDASANNVAVTLPSAMWQTGREVRYCNVSTSGTNTVTVNAPADFPFSNVSGRTSVTVAQGGCVAFRATFNGNVAAPGNYWMQQ